MSTSQVLRDFAWTEKYRPSSLDEVALDADTRRLFDAYLEAGEIPHLFLSGPPGSGKTTIARILIEALDCNSITLNASAERGIDVVREKIGSFAQSMFGSRWNVVFLDESDSLTADAQTALRNTVEAFADRTRFIFTANNAYKVIGPIQSRCQCVAFARPPLKERLRILQRVLQAEGIKCAPKLALGYAERYEDMRTMLYQAQKAFLSSAAGVLPEVSVSLAADGATMVQALLGKRYGAFLELTRRGDFNATEVLRELFWAIPEDHEKAFFLRGTVAKGVHESAYTVDPVVLALGCIADCIQGL